jgi:uncharacterized membrane protein YfcA
MGNILLMPVLGVLVGIGAAFSGLGGGFLMVPILLFAGYSAHKAAQIGARLLEHVSTAHFKKIFACVLVGLAVYLFTQK